VTTRTQIISEANGDLDDFSTKIEDV